MRLVSGEESWLSQPVLWANQVSHVLGNLFSSLVG